MRHTRHSVGELIDRQVFLWKQEALAHGERDEVPHEESYRRPFGPYVTISRELGGGALDVAEELGRRLNWCRPNATPSSLNWIVYDRQILEEVAASAHVRAKVVESLDMHTRSWLEDYVATLPSMSGLSEVTFLHHLVRVMTTIARHGRAILVGRGANFFLPPEAGVRVRLVASFLDRVQWYAGLHGLEPRHAAERIIDEDKQRAEFVVHHFGRNIADPAGYDLTLNVSELSHAQVVDEILDRLDTKLGVKPGVAAGPHIAPPVTLRSL